MNGIYHHKQEILKRVNDFDLISAPTILTIVGTILLAKRLVEKVEFLQVISNKIWTESQYEKIPFNERKTILITGGPLTKGRFSYNDLIFYVLNSLQCFIIF